MLERIDATMPGLTQLVLEAGFRMLFGRAADVDDDSSESNADDGTLGETTTTPSRARARRPPASVRVPPFAEGLVNGALGRGVNYASAATALRAWRGLEIDKLDVDVLDADGTLLTIARTYLARIVGSGESSGGGGPKQPEASAACLRRVLVALELMAPGLHAGRELPVLAADIEWSDHQSTGDETAGGGAPSLGDAALDSAFGEFCALVARGELISALAPFYDACAFVGALRLARGEELFDSQRGFEEAFCTFWPATAPPLETEETEAAPPPPPVKADKAPLPTASSWSVDPCPPAPTLAPRRDDRSSTVAGLMVPPLPPSMAAQGGAHGVGAGPATVSGAAAAASLSRLTAKATTPQTRASRCSSRLVVRTASSSTVLTTCDDEPQR